VSPLIINLLKLAFLAVIYGFLWYVAGALRGHLWGRRPRDETASVEIRHPPAAAGQTIPVRATVVVGRSDQADITLDDPYASDFHARIRPSDGALEIQDLDSTNGTYVNGTAIEEATPLRSGDEIRIGETIMGVR
jgi:hypothetical protein